MELKFACQDGNDHGLLLPGVPSLPGLTLPEGPLRGQLPSAEPAPPSASCDLGSGPTSQWLRVPLYKTVTVARPTLARVWRGGKTQKVLPVGPPTFAKASLLLCTMQFHIPFHPHRVTLTGSARTSQSSRGWWGDGR